jgi:hypothetical protein
MPTWSKEMRRRHHHDDDDILEDGQTLRVPMFAMDSLTPLQRAVAQSTARITDGSGGVAGLHRPGFRLAATDARKVTRRNPRGCEEGTREEEEEHGTERQTSDAAMRARDKTYADYEKDLVDAYRIPPSFQGVLRGGGLSPDIVQRGWGDATCERTCPDCDGSGEIGGGECETCAANGVVEQNAEGIMRNANVHPESTRRVDCRSVTQMMRDHQNKMSDAYDKLDRELSETWRRS